MHLTDDWQRALTRDTMNVHVSCQIVLQVTMYTQHNYYTHKRSVTDLVVFHNTFQIIFVVTVSLSLSLCVCLCVCVTISSSHSSFHQISEFPP